MDAHVVEDAEAEERVAISRQPARGDERAGSRAEEGEELVGGRAGERARCGEAEDGHLAGEDGGFGGGAGRGGRRHRRVEGRGRALGAQLEDDRVGGVAAHERANVARGVGGEHVRHPDEVHDRAGWTTVQANHPRRAGRRRRAVLVGGADGTRARCPDARRATRRTRRATPTRADRRPRQPTDDPRVRHIAPARPSVPKTGTRATPTEPRAGTAGRMHSRTARMMYDHDFPQPVA